MPDPRLDVNIAADPGIVNGSSPIPVDYLAEARDTLDGAPIGELDRLAHAAGELYGDALRDQLHRAIEAVVLSLAAANRSITRGLNLRDDDLTRLHAAVDQWADDYRTIDRGYQQAADDLVRTADDLVRTGAELERTAAELATIVGTYRRGGQVSIDVMDDVLNRFANLQSPDRHTPDPLAGEAPAEPQPGTSTPLPPADVIAAAANVTRLIDRYIGAEPGGALFLDSKRTAELCTAVRAWRDAHTNAGLIIEP